MTLADYIARMKSGQDRIYYLIADSLTAARGSPYLEQLRAKGIEVLLLADRVDEWMMGHLREFEGKRLIQRHQRVYATLGNRMVTDEVHALSMRTYSPAEWEKMSDAEKAGT